MKIAILVGDGMGDYPSEALGGRTVLQAARIPWMRRIAGAARVRQVCTVPDGMSAGSDVANLSLMGYDPAEGYTGRAPIEAAGAGIALGPRDVAFRCNFVTVADGRMADYSAGHLATEDGAALIDALAAALGRDGLRFYAGVGYRHLLVWRDGPVDADTAPPHDIAGHAIAAHRPAGAGGEAIEALMEASREILAEHPVNRRRRGAGLAEATQVWLWGQGRAMRLAPYPERFGLRGGVVSAVDLVRGLGVLAGPDAPRVPGATGFLDTDYEAKVAAARAHLERGDFVYLHVEAPDECGHMGDVTRKVEACEAFDARVVGPFWQGLEAAGEPYRLILATDHRTPCAVRGHTREPVPMAWLDGPVGPATTEAAFDETAGDGSSCPAHAWVREALEGACRGA